MERSAAKDLIYGGIQELMRNRDYYYHSSVNVDYSHWTELGIGALAEFLNSMAWIMQRAEEEYLDKRAKVMVLNTLKGEKPNP
jgi:hypothetical protein